MKKQKPIQESFCFIQKHNHRGKTPHRFAFNFSYMYLTDHEKLTRDLNILPEYLRAAMLWNMFCCTFTRRRFPFKGGTYWNFIQRQDLLKFYYSKLLVLNVPPLRGLLVKAPLLTIKADNSSIDRTYLNPQQTATSESQQHPWKFKAGVKISTILHYFTQQKASLRQRKNRYFKRHLCTSQLRCASQL